MAPRIDAGKLRTQCVKTKSYDPYDESYQLKEFIEQQQNDISYDFVQNDDKDSINIASPGASNFEDEKDL